MSDLARPDELIKRIDFAVTTPPADGSVAATELADETRAHTYDLTVMGMMAAIDHLHAWRFLLEAGMMPTYAHLSLIRTAHESALLAYWSLPPRPAQWEGGARNMPADATPGEGLGQDALVGIGRGPDRARGRR